MSNLIKQSFANAQQTARTRFPKKAGFKKKYRSRRIRLKRLRERVYLSHFLAVNGIQPEHIICGEDDGKEPDFTLIIDNQYIGVELTTLPRLRDRIGDKHLLLKNWYWKLRAKLAGIKTFFCKKLLRTFQVSWHTVFQHLHFYHAYDSHHDHFSHHHHHRHHQNKYKTAQLSEKHATLKALSNINTANTSSPVAQSPTLVTFPTVQRRSPKLNLASHAVNYCKQYLTQRSNFFAQTTESNTPLSFISQADMDAVMEKKAHKALGYHRRRPLDALWLLVHTDGQQPNMEIALPPDSSTPIHHDSAYDAVWLTVYPKRLSYKVQRAYKVAAA